MLTLVFLVSTLFAPMNDSAASVKAACACGPACQCADCQCAAVKTDCGDKDKCPCKDCGCKEGKCCKDGKCEKDCGCCKDGKCCKDGDCCKKKDCKKDEGKKDEGKKSTVAAKKCGDDCGCGCLTGGACACGA
jgi:hypothetical protein